MDLFFDSTWPRNANLFFDVFLQKILLKWPNYVSSDKKEQAFWFSPLLLDSIAGKNILQYWLRYSETL